MLRQFTREKIKKKKICAADHGGILPESSVTAPNCLGVSDREEARCAEGMLSAGKEAVEAIDERDDARERSLPNELPSRVEQLDCRKLSESSSELDVGNIEIENVDERRTSIIGS